MKTIKLLFVGLLLCTMTTFMCRGEGIISTLSGTTDITTFTAKFQPYMDPVQLAAFITAYEANQKSDSPLEWEAFCVNYVANNSAFQTAFLEAWAEYKEANELTDEDAATSISEQIAELKEQIDEMEKLSEEEKEKYKELLDKYGDLANQMASQLANANNALADALGNSTGAQQMDPMMMIMMIMMMMMMMGQQGGGGGSSCSGGSCGG